MLGFVVNDDFKKKYEGCWENDLVSALCKIHRTCLICISCFVKISSNNNMCDIDKKFCLCVAHWFSLPLCDWHLFSEVQECCFSVSDSVSSCCRPVFDLVTQNAASVFPRPEYEFGNQHEMKAVCFCFLSHLPLLLPSASRIVLRNLAYHIWDLIQMSGIQHVFLFSSRGRGSARSWIRVQAWSCRRFVDSPNHQELLRPSLSDLFFNCWRWPIFIKNSWLCPKLCLRGNWPPVRWLF